MGKTVTTYLIDGDPKGTQYAFISNKICQMFVVSHSNRFYFNTQEGLYLIEYADLLPTFLINSFVSTSNISIPLSL
jgi:hypothetical protein